MTWTQTYSVNGDYAINPFFIDFIFDGQPTVITATRVNDLTYEYKIGILILKGQINTIGDIKGVRTLIYGGNQEYRLNFLPSMPYKAEFLIFDWVGPVSLTFWKDV